MKKIITLLITAGSFLAVNAQTSKEEARRVILGGEKNSGDGNTSTRGRDIILGDGNGNENTRSNPNRRSNQGSIDQVNREYDTKINSVRNNGTLTQSEKERMIRQLEKDRAKRIKEINKNSNSKGYNKGKKNKKYDDDDDRYEKRNDNGKHKGWTKGKGNQKKNKHRD